MDADEQVLLDKAIKLIESSDLSEDDRDILITRVPLLEDKSIETFVKFCSDDPSLINMLVENLKTKLEAQNNPDKINEIVEREREDLMKIINEN